MGRRGVGDSARTPWAEGKHTKEAEGVLESVVKAQSLQVDAVTGATTTSKAFLKAAERALKKGISE